MASKSKTVFVCENCGYESAKWSGKCPSCGEWNTFSEETILPAAGSARSAAAPAADVVSLDEADSIEEVRYVTGWSELDRVFGGGIVKGSLVLIGGEPGVGKSTLLLQICQSLCSSLRVLYVSGEESVRQLKMRASRLGVRSPSLCLLTETDVDTILGTVEREKPDLVIIDSIQTMYLRSVSSSSGSVTQVRESTSRFQQAAKSHDVSFLLVGHVNKDGAIAGPKVLEHIVDAVLQLEGERSNSFRILRAAKNRYGSTNEIGVFDMKSDGLEEVPNPSARMLEGRPLGVSGACVTCIMEGTRPLLTEVQALAAKSSFSAPRRVSTGFDYSRLMMLIAILEKRVGYFCGNLDVYVNVIGGLRLDEPAADLPVLLSLYSAICDAPIPEDWIAFGEVGLTGEVRSVSQIESRIAESTRLGFTSCILPKTALRGVDPTRYPIELLPVSGVGEALALLRAAKKEPAAEIEE